MGIVVYEGEGFKAKGEETGRHRKKTLVLLVDKWSIWSLVSCRELL